MFTAHDIHTRIDAEQAAQEYRVLRVEPDFLLCLRDITPQFLTRVEAEALLANLTKALAS